MRYRKFYQENKKTLIVLMIFTFLFGIQRICFFNIGYDTDEFLNVPNNTMNVWIGSGRYTLVLLKRILGFLGRNVYIINILTYINIYLYTVAFLYFINLGNFCSEKYRNLLAGTLLVSSPIFLEQYYFTLQAAEISFTMILLMAAFIKTYQFLSEKKVKYFLMTYVLLILCFGSYQAFINLYILGVLICLYKLNEEKAKENLIRIFQCIAIWAGAVGGYFVIINFVRRIFHTQDNGYLSIMWFTEPFGEVFRYVAGMIKQVILGTGNVLNLSYTICFIFVLIQILRTRKWISWKNFYLAMMFLSPFLLNIVTGNPLLIRATLTLPLLCAFLFYEYFTFGRGIKIAAAIVLVSQIVHGQLLIRSDQLRYQNDLEIARKIYADCNADENTHIAMIGLEKTEENISVFEGQIIGQSFFEWSVDDKNVEEVRVNFFMRLHDLPFQMPTEKEWLEADSITFSAEYPEEGYIVKKNDCYYVNLGK